MAALWEFQIAAVAAVDVKTENVAIAIQAVLVLQLALRTASCALGVAAISPAGAASSGFSCLTLHTSQAHGAFSASLGEPSISMPPASDPNEAGRQPLCEKS